MLNTSRILTIISALCVVTACTPAVSNESAKAGVTKGGDGSDKTDASETPPHPNTVDVAVGSVLLEDDCPDAAETPAAIDPVVPASVVPPSMPARKEQPPADAGAPGQPQPQAAGVVAPTRRACRQSTLQVTFDNHGAATTSVHIVEVRLRDVATDTVVATLASRSPTQWSEADNAYVTWDETLAASSATRASYHIAAPAWYEVEKKLDGSDSHHRTFDVEVALELDGKPTTARSAEFTRPPAIIMPPT